jgi:hypothetical protein
MGKNGQVVGDLEAFGDYQYTQEAMRIIREHDTTIPLFYYGAHAIHNITYCNYVT